MNNFRSYRSLLTLLLAVLVAGCIEDPADFESILGDDWNVAEPLDVGDDSDIGPDVDGAQGDDDGDIGGEDIEDHQDAEDGADAPDADEPDPPEPFASSLALWFRADTSVDTTEGAVVSWRSLDEQALLAERDGPDAEIRVVGQALAGHPAVRFGAQGGLVVDDFDFPTEAYTVAAVVIPRQTIYAGNAGARTILAGPASLAFNEYGTGSLSLTLESGDGDTPDLSRTSTSTTTWFAGVPYLALFTFDGITGSAYLQGSLQTTVSLLSPLPASGPLYLGGHGDLGSLTGDLVELRIYDRAPDDDELESLHAELLTRYHFYTPGAAWLDALDSATVAEAGALNLSEEQIQRGRFQTVPPQPSCAAHRAQGRVLSGLYALTPEGVGVNAPLQVYCEMTVDGGGWQLISVVRPDHPTEVFLGNRYCRHRDPDQPCFGRIHPNQVQADGQILVYSEGSGQWLSYAGFSATPESSLRYFSGELELTNTDDCGVETDNRCAPLPDPDPDLVVHATSGFPVNLSAPLVQFWRWGGWWIGAEPGAGNVPPGGRIHATSYDIHHDLRRREDPVADTELVSDGPQTIWYRQPLP